MADEDLDLPTDYMRLDIIRALLAAGHGGRIVISHDICTRTRLCAFGGHGYGHILRHVVPLMRRRGFADGQIEELLVTTPARLLAYLSAPGAGRAA
jgi:phosphotriesterase-related protein